MSNNAKRREFLRNLGRIGIGLGLAGIAGVSIGTTKNDGYVWQIDPFKCTFCGRCATDCVINPSAVKCVHAYALCGYCDLCGGYLKPGHNARNTAAENMLCPTAAIKRTFIEDPYYQYSIIEDLCIGCAICVAGCTAFGNGSFHLQIRHNLCKNCNECAISVVCPSDAISRVPTSKPYLMKGGFEP